MRQGAMDGRYPAYEKKHLLIGERTAEQIKIEIGSAYRLETPLEKEVYGHDLGQIGGCLQRSHGQQQEIAELRNPYHGLAMPSAGRWILVSRSWQQT